MEIAGLSLMIFKKKHDLCHAGRGSSIIRPQAKANSIETRLLTFEKARLTDPKHNATVCGN